MNNHHLGLSLDTFASSPDLAAMFHVTSVNTDRQGRSFVSTIEPIYPDLHPFYGVQYHPEKNMFEYGTYPGTNMPYEAIHHDPDAIDFSLHLARFFCQSHKPQFRTRHSPIHPARCLSHGLHIPDATRCQISTILHHSIWIRTIISFGTLIRYNCT